MAGKGGSKGGGSAGRSGGKAGRGGKGQSIDFDGEFAEGVAGLIGRHLGIADAMQPLKRETGGDSPAPSSGKGGGSRPKGGGKKKKDGGKKDSGKKEQRREEKEPKKKGQEPPERRPKTEDPGKTGHPDEQGRPPRGTKPDNADGFFEPGPFAEDSIPARSKAQKFTEDEIAANDANGYKHGCHTCGDKDPGRPSGHFTPDHQPVSSLVPDGTPQKLYPHCASCSSKQGGYAGAETRRRKKH